MNPASLLHFHPSWGLRHRPAHHDDTRTTTPALGKPVEGAKMRSWRRRKAHAAPAGQEGAQEAEADDDDNWGDLEALLSKAANIITLEDKLVLSGPDVNLGIVIWQAIREVPPQHRHRLVGMLNAGAIKRLWRGAGQRYFAPLWQVAAAIGPDYSVWSDFPDGPEQIVHFQGRAAVPLAGLVGGFDVALFLHPDSEAPYGRVIAPWGPLDMLYPLYFSCNVGQDLVPGSEELCDLSLRFFPPEELGLQPDDIPRSAWAKPSRPLPPFNQGFTAFLRAAGPGVFVGRGVRTLVREPEESLFFVMSRQRVESLLA